MNRKAVRGVLSLIAEAEASALESVAVYHAELVARMAAVFPCEVVSFNEFQVEQPEDPRGTPTVTCTNSPPLEPRDAMPVALLPAFFRHMAEHPLIRLQARGDLGARRLSDATNMRRFRRGPLYGEFFGPAGISHQLSLGPEASPGCVTGMWFSRARRDFSDDDLLVAELLRPRLRECEVAVRRAAARTVLTSREREVLDIVAGGASNRDVARALTVSPATVKKHLDNIYSKLEVGTRAAAADRASTSSRRAVVGTALIRSVPGSGPSA